MRKGNLKLIIKDKEYRKYIDDHRRNVRKAWELIKLATDKYAPYAWEKDNGIEVMEELIKSHDISKYGIEEFEPYRKKFYPKDNEVIDSIDEKRFEEAWEHHQQHNPHHWQTMEAMNYDCKLMVEYTLEMICDWLAMAMNFGETHRGYWDKNRDNIRLLDWQEDLIEEVYDALDKWLENDK